MLWLASFPRSGNTFFRNVLHDVYGIPSATYHEDPGRPLDDNFGDVPVYKTHLLPEQLPEFGKDWPAVYLVRDGRDALVSMAHHRKDIVVPGSDFYNNLVEATLAQHGSFFGGWSGNVSAWVKRAAVVIRFEELIKDPIREIEKIRGLIDLPAPDISKLPTFASLREGQPAYGGGSGDSFRRDRNQYHFRRGQIGSWKEEAPPEVERLMNLVHGTMLSALDYAPASAPPESQHSHKILIEAGKLFTPDNDGIKRYLAGLDYGLNILLPHYPQLDVKLYYGNGVLVPNSAQPAPETQFEQRENRKNILADFRSMGYEKVLLLLKEAVKTTLPDPVYRPLAKLYRQGPYRRYLRNIKLQTRRLKGRMGNRALDKLIATADLIHLPLPQHFLGLPPTKAQVLVTVHDLSHRLFPEYHSEENVRFSEQGMQLALKHQANFLSVSSSTDNDLTHLYAIPPARRYTVPEAADSTQFHRGVLGHSFDHVRRRYQIPETPYLLCLSTIEPRKNLRRSLEAFVQLKENHPELEATLVVSGKRGWKTEAIFAGLELDRPDIILTGFVSDEHLPLLYAHARALCYPSLYEGFGLPIVEAMACGTPVIYGNNSSQGSVAGKGGLPVDAENTDAIAHAMLQLLTDDEFQRSLSETAWRQSNRFSWLKTALQTIHTYETILKEAQ